MNRYRLKKSLKNTNPSDERNLIKQNTPYKVQLKLYLSNEYSINKN